MSSIYLYIIYISRPWFKGSGAAMAGSGSISDIHSLASLLPLCYSTHKSSFCEEERVQRWPSFSLSSSTGGKNGCVPKDFNQKHAGCRETSGVFCCERGSGLWVQGSGLWWRLRRMLDDGIFISSAFPKGEGLDGATLRVNLYKERSPIKNHSRPFLWKGQTSEARRGWHPRV